MENNTAGVTYSPIQFLQSNYMNDSFRPFVCYSPTMVSMNGLWLGENLLSYTMPLFLVQLILIVITTRAIAIILEPFRIPRFICEVIGGFVLGPSVMGQLPDFSVSFFPVRSLLVLDAVGHIGLIYYIFTVGVEVQPRAVKTAGRARSLTFAAMSIFSTFPVGQTLGPIIHRRMKDGVSEAAFLVFIGVALCVTSLSAIARVLAELKLIGTDVGRLSLSVAVLSDAYAWALLCLAVSLAHNEGNLIVSVWAVLSGFGLMMFCYLAVRPTIRWVERKTPEGEEVDELHACAILVGVLIAAFVADAIGTHAIFGAFAFGWSLPNGPVGQVVVEKVEDLVEGLLLPLFYVFSGLSADLSSITDATAAVLLVVVVLGGAVIKVAGLVMLSAIFRMPLEDGLSLGILMNTKGVMELVVLNIGRDKQVLRGQSYTVMLIMSVVMTAMVFPLQVALVRPARRLMPHKRRTIRWQNPESEIRLLACVHTPRNTPAIIAVLDTSNPTKRSPLFVYALHLVELTGRASAMIIANNPDGNDKHGFGHGGFLDRIQTQTEQITQAFEAYKQHAGGVSVKLLSAFSPYNTMHEDVCAIAEDKHVALILLTFHKHLTVDGVMEVTNPAICHLNEHVLSSAPCSVGIIVDRGLGKSGLGQFATRRIAVLFLGGPDDREVLAYAARMTGHPGTTLTVLRLVPPETWKGDGAYDKERLEDEQCINELRERNDEGLVYEEQESGSAEETVAAIRAMGSEYDLYLVGRGEGEDTPMTAGMMEFAECPELGAIGDFLASGDFLAMASVLVLQQGRATGRQVPEEVTVPDSPGKQVKLNVYRDHASK